MTGRECTESASEMLLLDLGRDGEGVAAEKAG
jgi:hypothetical protein